MDLPPDKAKVLRQYDSSRKWEMICDQVGHLVRTTLWRISPRLLTPSPSAVRLTPARGDPLLLSPGVDICSPVLTPSPPQW